MNHQKIAEDLESIVQDAGRFCLDRFERLSTFDVEEKAPSDYVSAVDREAEALIKRALEHATPDIPVNGEEHGGDRSDLYWSVDPIDGTANFLTGLPIWAVSIALIRCGTPVLGAICIPAFGWTLIGGKEVPLRIHGTTATEDGACLAFGVGRNPCWSQDHRARTEETLESAGYQIVCLGSCAASLAFVALGRLAGYIEHDIDIWDCAAGSALCQSVGLTAAMQVNKITGKVNISTQRSRPAVN